MTALCDRFNNHGLKSCVPYGNRLGGVTLIDNDIYEPHVANFSMEITLCNAIPPYAGDLTMDAEQAAESDRNTQADGCDEQGDRLALAFRKRQTAAVLADRMRAVSPLLFCGDLAVKTCRLR